jgi:hypothetical protein
MWTTCCRSTALVASTLTWLLATAVSVTAHAQSPVGRMPTVTAQNLSETTFILPAQLPAARTLVLMAFEREQQVLLNTWVDALSLKDNKLPWIETPVIGKGYGLFRVFIDNGMRRGIPDPALRERTITLYTDPAALRRDMGLSGDGKEVWVLVVDRTGLVLAQAPGSYSADKAKPLLEALNAAPPPAR